jgi:AcrR family transcriptional regulator
MRTAETKRRLLEATLGLISERGYLGATTREIAKKAGVTEITLFRHFGSKERLFEEVLNAYTFLPRMRELLPGLDGCSYPEALTIIGIRFLETLKERKALFKIMNAEAHLYPGRVRETYRKFIQDTIHTLAGYLKTLQRQGKLRDFPTETGAKSFLGMLVSFFRNEEVVNGRTIGEKELERTIRTFVDIFAYGTAGDRRQKP